MFATPAVDTLLVMANILRMPDNSLVTTVRRGRVPELRNLASELGLQFDATDAKNTSNRQTIEGLKDVVVTCAPGSEEALNQYEDRVKAMPTVDPQAEK